MIQTLLRSGKKFSASNLTIYREDPPLIPTERYAAAFLVGYRSGNAVRRNRIRRWLREDFRLLESESESPGNFVIKFKGGDIVIDHITLSGELKTLYNSIKADG